MPGEEGPRGPFGIDGCNGTDGTMGTPGYPGSPGYYFSQIEKCSHLIEKVQKLDQFRNRKSWFAR